MTLKTKRHPAIEKQCRTCGKLFKCKHAERDKRFNCSKQCHIVEQTSSILAQCVHCGAGMRLNNIDLKRNKKYCSRTCYFNSGKHAEALKKANERTPRNYWLGKKRPEMTGEKNWKWNGGESRNSRHWAMGQIEYKQWRKSVFEKDNYTCQICTQHGGTLHADHIESWAGHEDLRYKVSNGRTLCVPCHYFITFKKKMLPGNKWCGFLLKEG